MSVRERVAALLEAGNKTSLTLSAEEREGLKRILGEVLQMMDDYEDIWNRGGDKPLVKKLLRRLDGSTKTES
jgi:hypothetical protein